MTIFIKTQTNYISKHMIFTRLSCTNKINLVAVLLSKSSFNKFSSHIPSGFIVEGDASILT